VDTTEMQTLIDIMENEFKAGLLPKAQVIRAKLDVAVAKAQLKSTRYMLWSVIITAVAALISAASVIVPLMHRLVV
jgi:hypothetical protein